MIGTGAMGSALISGFLRACLISPEDLFASDVRQEPLIQLGDRFKIRLVANNSEAAQFGRVLIIAVKPVQVKNVLEEIAPLLTPDHLVISIAAGITLAYLEARVPQGIPVIRAMPNIPALIGEGVTVLALGKYAGVKEREEAEALFGSVGQVITLPEENIDAVTGLSGSGPAYIFLILDALADGGVKMGLPRQIAMELALQTMMGAARMVARTGDHPGLLKDRVTSPGGSTIAGLHVLEQGGLRGLLISAVEAATKRARELQF